MKTIIFPKYYNDSRCITLNKWCNENVGRTTKLCDELDQDSIFRYKSGRVYIGDLIWNKMQNGMIEVESHETKKSPVKNAVRLSSYTKPSNKYHKAVLSLSNEKTLNAFAKFCNVPFTTDTINNDEFRDVIVNNYDQFLIMENRAKGHRLCSHTFKLEFDKWKNIIKERLFNLIYPCINGNKMQSNTFNTFYKNTFVLNDYIKGNTYSDVKLAMQIIDELIINKDPLITLVTKNSVRKTINLMDVNYYKMYVQNINCAA